MGTEPSLGEQFVTALAAQDRAALTALLRDDVDFRAMTPGRFWEAEDAVTVVDGTLLRYWFEPDDVITGVLAVDTGRLGPRSSVRYRLAVTSRDEPCLVEQQAYYETDGDRISWLRIMCAGMLPVDEVDA
jgi:hypothetical protein